MRRGLYYNLKNILIILILIGICWLPFWCVPRFHGNGLYNKFDKECIYRKNIFGALYKYTLRCVSSGCGELWRLKGFVDYQSIYEIDAGLVADKNGIYTESIGNKLQQICSGHTIKSFVDFTIGGYDSKSYSSDDFRPRMNLPYYISKDQSLKVRPTPHSAGAWMCDYGDN